MTVERTTALHADQHAVARDPRREAQRVVGDTYDARVLEPSPPAVVDGDWFADDPVALDRTSGRPLIGPVSGVDVTWRDWVAEHPEHADWAAARWLGTYRHLSPPPPTFAETRLALHRLAVYVVSPARRRVNGKMALRWTLDGFGTPFFGSDEQVRVAGDHLVRQRGGTAAVEAITTLSRAAAFALDGEPDLAWAEGFDVPPAGDLDEPLALDRAAAAALADWYGFAYSVLEELRADAATRQPNRVQLWPEHFDAAFDALAGPGRATFGASPGDAHVEQPYLYVLPPEPDAVGRSALWNATGFRGAVLPLGELVHRHDQRAEALAFLRTRRAALER